MVDGAIVLVDASEGPMPQTKFVVSKALKIGLRPIVAINKIDKPDERHVEVLNEIFDLFANLDATEEQLDFPILYGSAKQGWMAVDPNGPERRHGAAVRSRAEARRAAESGGRDFRMLATTIEADPFLGRILTGRVSNGVMKPNMAVKALSRDGKLIDQGRVSKVLGFRGLERQPIEEGKAGDIIAIAGLTKATVADTICDPQVSDALPAQPIDPPTLTMTFRINDGPFSGQEGDKVQSRVIRDRLLREAEGNVALRITETQDSDAYEVSGRGELQLGILIETMRREEFELTVSRPRVVFDFDPETGQRPEPIEEVIIDVDEDVRSGCFQALRAQGRSHRDASLRRRPAAAHFLCPDPRADRLSGRTPDRHARHGDHEPPLPYLRAL